MTRLEMMNDRQGDQQPPQDCVSRTTRVALIAVLIGATLVLYGRGLTQSAGGYGDAVHHLMNGIFVHDALADPARSMAHPIEYGFRYYRYFPAVNIGYYPTVFPLLSGILMLVFGVSGTTGQLTVLLLAVALTLFSFEWFRLRLETWWAAGATVLLIPDMKPPSDELKNLVHAVLPSLDHAMTLIEAAHAAAHPAEAAAHKR